ncbi:regulator [Streptomyces sp. NPDC050600]|uniref:ATP-binding protein n=1 Tax=Streptomyces sp. NPDC050600 TaxID=3157213 RepID=UPI00342B5154
MESWQPPESGPFVGRGEAVGDLGSLLSTRPLVTLVGMGGIGKSRLAARVAEEFGPGAPGPAAPGPAGPGPAGPGPARDGLRPHPLRPGAPRPDAPRPDAFAAVHWTPLWSLTSPSLVTSLVADACGLSDHSAGDPVDTVADWIGARRVLLVLDSCEHVLDACAALVRVLLARCPALVVLATSREPLGVAGETRFPVGPLEPDSEAMELFAARAEAMGVRWTRPEEYVAAADVCRWLEGVPLALELAAGMLRERPVSAMARLLRGRLALARGPESRVQPARHRALRTTIGWSHELCDPHERLLWARLSVFRSGATVEDVTRVCRGGPLTDSVLARALEGLVRKSVVTRSDDRVHLYDTVREYGALWLAELGETRATGTRHARRFHELALAAEESWWGPGQAETNARLTASYGDLCAALEHLLATDPQRAAELAGAVGFFWACSGHLHEASHYLEECLRLVAGPSAVRARLCWALGVVRCLRGEYDTAARLAGGADEEAVRAGDATLLADAAYLRGLVMLLRGEPRNALAVADRALAGPASGPAATARCRLVRVFALTASGALRRARAAAEALRDDSVAVGEHWTRSYTEYQLAVIALFEERASDAAAHARAMLRDKRLIGDAFGLGLGLDLLAVALAALERGEEAAVAYGAGQVFWEMVGHPQRGTPELRPLRQRAERAARLQIGDAAYDTAYELARIADPFRTLETMLAG